MSEGTEDSGVKTVSTEEFELNCLEMIDLVEKEGLAFLITEDGHQLPGWCRQQRNQRLLARLIRQRAGGRMETQSRERRASPQRAVSATRRAARRKGLPLRSLLLSIPGFHRQLIRGLAFS